jgi:hypothetical protein
MGLPVFSVGPNSILECCHGDIAEQSRNDVTVSRVLLVVLFTYSRQ